MNRPPRLANGAGDLLRLISPRLDNPKCDAFSRAGPNPGHRPQLRNQIPERGRVFGLSQNARWLTGGRFGRMQRERLEPAQIQLQRRIVL